MTGKWLLVALALIPALADLASTVAAPSGFWSQFLPTLYYAAIVIAGLELGWKAGLGLSFFAGLCHWLIAYFVLSSPFARLQAQILAFLVVGFALIEERRKATERLTRSPGEGTGLLAPHMDSQACIEQVSAIASELLREVRTPIASIEGAAFILEENASRADKPVEFVDIIRKECRRLNQALSEIGACTEVLSLHCQPTDVALMLAEAVRLSALQLPNPTIDLRTAVASNLPRVWCDKKQLLELIVPFIINAMNSMPTGGEILLAADRQDGLARIQLKVLGQTIRACDPSAGRGPYSSTFDPDSGLRLLSARRTVLQHGGTIEVDQTGPHERLSSLTIPLYNGQHS